MVRKRSFLTVLFFLTEEFEDGATQILEPRARHTVEPSTGSVLLVEHALLHEGATVTFGRKYIMRTDVMCRLGAS